MNSQTVAVHLTQEHISRGQSSDCNKCPVALAINEVLATGFYAAVGGDTIRIFSTTLLRKADSPTGHTYLVKEFFAPLEVSTFVDLFDTTEEAKPMSFELELPALCLPNA